MTAFVTMLALLMPALVTMLAPLAMAFHARRLRVSGRYHQLGRRHCKGHRRRQTQKGEHRATGDQLRFDFFTHFQLPEFDEVSKRIPP